MFLDRHSVYLLQALYLTITAERYEALSYSHTFHRLSLTITGERYEFGLRSWSLLSCEAF
jgi:hypothetical protein